MQIDIIIALGQKKCNQEHLLRGDAAARCPMDGMGEKLLAALLALMDIYGSGVMDVQRAFVG